VVAAVVPLSFVAAITLAASTSDPCPHIVVAATHFFDQTLLDTVIRPSPSVAITPLRFHTRTNCGLGVEEEW